MRVERIYETLIPTKFAKSYPEVSFNIINQDNYLDFIL